MQPDEDKKQRSDDVSSGSLARSIAVPLAALILSVVGWLVLQRRPDSVPPPPAVAPQPATRLSQAFFDSKVAPVELRNHKANRESADRCIARIDDSFREYRDGVPAFVTDITSIGTRFGVLRRMPSDWWYEHDSVTPFIRQKFEEHVFAEKRLEQDLSAALTAFREELRTNRNSFLSEVKAAVSESMLPHLETPDYTSFDRQVVESLTDVATKQAEDSVYRGVVTLLSSEIASVAATEVVAVVLSTLSTTVAVEAAAAGGATVGGAAAGGSVGTVGGPAGMAVGVGVGLVVGILVDWWMTDGFRDKVTGDLEKYIQKVRDAIVEGDGTTGGVRAALTRYCDDLHAVQSDLLRDQLVGELK